MGVPAGRHVIESDSGRGGEFSFPGFGERCRSVLGNAVLISLRSRVFKTFSEGYLAVLLLC